MAPSTFSRALALVFKHEGGFADHPADPGGPTRFGITQATLARARGATVSVDDVRTLTRTEAATIYRTLFWNEVGADELPAGLDLAVFDIAVNAGPGRAARLLQASLGVPQDGLIGPITLAAARDADRTEVIQRLTEGRLRFLSGLAGWPVFGRGWHRRTLAVAREALRLARDRPTISTASEIPMIDTKPILTSRTVWANLVGLGAVALGLLGFDTSQLDPGAFADAAVQLIVATSFVASTVFRIAATRQLAR